MTVGRPFDDHLFRPGIASKGRSACHGEARDACRLGSAGTEPPAGDVPVLGGHRTIAADEQVAVLRVVGVEGQPVNRAVQAKEQLRLIARAAVLEAQDPSWPYPGPQLMNQEQLVGAGFVGDADRVGDLELRERPPDAVGRRWVGRSRDPRGGPRNAFGIAKGFVPGIRFGGGCLRSRKPWLLGQLGPGQAARKAKEHGQEQCRTHPSESLFLPNALHCSASGFASITRENPPEGDRRRPAAQWPHPSLPYSRAQLQGGRKKGPGSKGGNSRSGFLCRMLCKSVTPFLHSMLPVAQRF